MNISSRIKDLRKEKKYSQEKLAELMNVTIGAVSKWENGLSYPDINNLMDLARLFNVSVDYLLDFNLNNASYDTLVNKLEECLTNKVFTYSIEEVKELYNKYSNDFKLVYILGVYCFTYAITTVQLAYLKLAKEYFIKSLDLFNQNNDKTIKISEIHKHIISCEINLDNFKGALDFINNHNVENVEYEIASCYLGLKDYDKAIESFSNGYVGALSNLINCLLLQTIPVYLTKNKKEAIEACDFAISLIQLLSEDESVLSSSVIGLAYLLKALFNYNSEEYYSNLTKSVEVISKKVERDNINKTIKFYYNQKLQLLTSLEIDPIKGYFSIIEDYEYTNIDIEQVKKDILDIQHKIELTKEE